MSILDSRQHLRGVLLDLEQLPGGVVAELLYGASDVLLLVYVRLVCALPGLDVYEGHPRVQCSEVLRHRQKSIDTIVIKNII